MVNELDNSNPNKLIGSFSGRYAFLSNFYPSPLRFRGEIFMNVEAAFQCAKTKDKDAAYHFAYEIIAPSQAKREGKALELREDWEDIKRKVMYKLLWQKFKIPVLREELIATKKAKLVEGNYWNDTYWGICKGKGENHLGKLLMKVRVNILENN